MNRYYGNFNPNITVFEVIQSLDDKIEKRSRRIDKCETELFELEETNINECNEEKIKKLDSRIDRMYDANHKDFMCIERIISMCNYIEIDIDD